ncbi:FAD-dependent monooxygenase [Pyxidicoccus parkwayensis]|uniref:FAD-dependent monooxygenase n=1 Tax=Pyxidicoccus parkwayensis TaxID=2813578 RepID=A0ABX7P4D3_9BACT|nr:FAD-dependent monooxygenase [Pyxidicoccus parkwaysis]QSQ25291.1 FAD-dependent monooxygenase [Pyxidicoccus parkwaysis]
MDEVVEVGIVGGGPTGLLLACELALAGVRVRVFERRTEPVRESRALTMHPRSLEVLALRGLEERFLSQGRPLPTGHFGMLDTRLDFSGLDTTYRFTLFLPQAVTEALLEERARELGVDLRRGHAVEELLQDVESVELSGTTEGRPFRCHARYVVGADGARSIVRQLAGIAFPGTDTTRTSMLGDVTLGSPPASPFLALTNARGGVVIVPLGPGIHRIIVTDSEREGTPLKEPVTLDELRASITRIAGSDLGMREPRWLSRFGNETRLAERYRAGRVLLAGDAAHMHFPAGGQGLNVGLQDAMNLGWKLAAVLKEGAPDALLDSYHRERHGVGHALLRNTEAQAALMGFTPETLALRELMNGLLKHPAVNRQLAEHLGGLDVRYPALDVLGSTNEASLLPEWTGRRLPDLELQRFVGGTQRLYSALHGGRWLRLQVTLSTRMFPDTVAGMEPSWRPRAEFLYARPAQEGELLQGVGWMLIRPDGHVARAWA